jgi:hypothetical protein
MRWGLQVPDIMLGGFSVLVPGRRGDNRNLDDGYSGRDHHLIVRSNEIKFFYAVFRRQRRLFCWLTLG